MDEEFKQKLRESLEAIDQRISAVEHLVNDVIIGGLKDAADEYADDEAYSVFVDTYGDNWKEFEPSMKVLRGEDYDMGSDLYEKVKAKRDTEGFDEANEVMSLLDEVKSKLEALKSLENKAPAAEDEAKAEEPADAEEKKEEDSSEAKGADEDIDEDELRRIYNGE